MPQSFQTRIEDLVGEAAAGDLSLTTTMMQDMFDDGLRAVIRVLPDDALAFAAKKTTFAPTDGVQVKNPRVLRVLRNDSSVNRMCVEIDISLAGAAAEKGSLHEASAFTPRYYLEPQASGFVTLKVLPASATSTDGILFHVVIPPVAISNTSMVAGFPEELEGLPVIYAAGLALLRESGVTRRISQDQVEAAITAMGQYIAILPSFVPPPSFTYSVTAISDALDKAQYLIDDATSTGMDDDVETQLDADNLPKATVTISAASQEISRANAAIQDELAQLREYEAELQGSTNQFSGELQKAASYLTEAQSRSGAAASYDGKSALAWKAGGDLIRQFRDEMELYRKGTLGNGR